MSLAKASHWTGPKFGGSRYSKALWISQRGRLVLSVERLRLYRWRGIAFPVTLKFVWLRVGRWRFLDITLGATR